MATGPTGPIESIVRGIRNRNPGNIRLSAEKWQGLSPTQKDTSFFQFVSMDFGIRAMARILRNYSDQHHLNTVAEIISRWAPDSENDTPAYIESVCVAMHVASNQPIDVHDSQVMFDLIRAIVMHENGKAGAFLVTNAAVTNGIEMAGK